MEGQYNSRHVPLSTDQSVTKIHLRTKQETKQTDNSSMSATALTGQAPIILGPLTTSFTPPPACATAVAVGSIESGGGNFLETLFGRQGSIVNIASLGQTCSRSNAIDDTSCWPPVSSGALTKSAPLAGWGFYSPGVQCPAGYATACSATGGSKGGAGWEMQFQLKEGETAVGCCPRCVQCTRYPCYR